jgi:hypothetical protein
MSAVHSDEARTLRQIIQNGRDRLSAWRGQNVSASGKAALIGR